uniref:WAP domain-containing protein n=1 Tax=Steinernema glaseri TaxID=37863 RepID=A0A1I7ZT20_9BILA
MLHFGSLWGVLLLAALTAPQKISWCEYYKGLGVPSPKECEVKPRAISRPVPRTVAPRVLPPQEETLTTVTQKPSFPVLPLCYGRFHSCMASSTECQSGTLCINSASNSKCCTSAQSRCPAPTEMNIQCRSSKPTNWCNADSDCGSSEAHVCCATGCGYNRCFNLLNFADRPSVFGVPDRGDYRFFSLMMSPDCPDPFTIPLTCSMPNPVSWCYQQSDCPSMNVLQPRRCCRTSCGYNACHVKIEGRWMIA